MTDNKSISEEFRQYTKRMLEIRELSSPDIHSFDSADSYSDRLRNNFRRIGMLAGENREMLDDILYPLLDSETLIDDDLAPEMVSLADSLINVGGETDDFENLDLPVALLISDKLMSDSMKTDDLVLQIKRMDRLLPIYYSLMNMTARIYTRSDISDGFREKGLELGKKFHKMLDKSFFLSIPDEDCRGIVLLNSRFMTAFFEGTTDESNKKWNLEILDWMLDIADDPFYHDAVPGYDWNYFKFRTYEYYLQSTEGFNSRGFNETQLQHIGDRAEEMQALCESDKEYFEEIIGYDVSPIHILRCRCFSGKISKKEYRDVLLNLYLGRDKNDFSMDGSFLNILVPMDLISLLELDNYKAEDVLLLKDIYHGLSAYLFHIPTNGVLSFMLDYFINFVRQYIDVPSGVSFEDFILQCIAAIHPPTYIHSCMVGQISERIAYHILRIKPEIFVGMPGCEDLEAVKRNSAKLLDYVYHAALCHDFGKICIIDTIFVYGRKLLDFEFDIIKSHPQVGADLLRHHISTRDYADVALGHHRWYNDSKGYPFDFNTSESPYKAVIDIVQCADCMDAATDSVGRSYNKGKTLDDFMVELKEDSGTRYAPWLYDLFLHQEVFGDVEFLLDEGRQRNYKDTFNLLKDVQDRG